MAAKTPTYDELMRRKDTQFVSEHGGYLYVKLPPTEYYDNTIWRVDKQTHEVFYMMFTEYLYAGLAEQATYLTGSLFGET